LAPRGPVKLKKGTGTGLGTLNPTWLTSISHRICERRRRFACAVAERMVVDERDGLIQGAMPTMIIAGPKISMLEDNL
jgi:hypothetical protein